jgi:glycosyltransferase involved in cell wall biosynthesis
MTPDPQDAPREGDRHGARDVPLRLAFYFVGGPGGSLISCKTLLGSLKEDIELTVLGSRADLIDELAAVRPGTATRKLPPVANKFDVSAIARQVAVVHRLRPDVLHVSCDNPWTSTYGLLAGLLTRTPTIATIHGPAPPAGRGQQLLVRRIAPFVAAYVSVSRASSRASESALGLPPGSVRTIYNAVPSPVAPTPQSAPGAPVIGAVARFSSEKGLDVLIAAFARLGRGRLVLIGDGEERQRLEALVEEHGLVDSVHFAGWVTGPWTAQWSLDALVVPSRSEGFGLAVVEAMLAGIPVVATDVGGLPELIEHERTGLLVAADDPGALAGAMARVIDDRDQALQRAETARLEARTRFAPASMAAAYEALYEEKAKPRRT